MRLDGCGLSVFRVRSGTNEGVPRLRFAPPPARARRAATYGAAFALIVLGGCDPAAEGSVCSEPWRKDEPALQRIDRPFLRYRAESGQSLSFSIQTKQVHLRGKVPLERAGARVGSELGSTRPAARLRSIWRG